MKKNYLFKKSIICFSTLSFSVNLFANQNLTCESLFKGQHLEYTDRKSTNMNVTSEVEYNSRLLPFTRVKRVIDGQETLYYQRITSDQKLKESANSSTILKPENQKVVNQAWVSDFNKKTWQAREITKQFLRKTLDGQHYLTQYRVYKPIQYTKKMGTIVLQHGFTHSMHDFHDEIRYFTHLGYEVILMDAANSGGTAKATFDFFGQDYVLKSPTPVDDALALRDVLRLEETPSFTLVGHSRGHAITATLAAMPEFENKIVKHFGFNPYSEWLVDYIAEYSTLFINPYLNVSKQIEGQLDVIKSNMNYLLGFFFSGNSFTYLLSKDQTSADPLRRTMNNQGVRKILETLEKYIDYVRNKNPELKNLSDDQILSLIQQVALGLIGISDLKGSYLANKRTNKDSHRGFEILSLYGIAVHKLTNSHGGYNNFIRGENEGISTQIPASVLEKTVLVYSGEDNLVKPTFIETRFVNAARMGYQMVKIGGNHFSVSEQSAFVTEFIRQRIEAFGSK